MRAHVCTVLSAAAFLMASPPQARAQGGAGPSPRFSSAAAYDGRRGAVVLYGGDEDPASGVGFLDDTWQWDGSEWSLQPIGGAPPMATHAMAYDTSRGVSVMYNVFSIWERGAGAWVFLGSTSLSNGLWPTLVYDSARSVSILHGGWPTYPQPCGAGTEEWNGVEWAHRPWGPANEFGHAAAFDTIRERMVVLNAQGCGVTARETWEFDGAEWFLRSTSGPSSRWFSSMAFDSARGVCVLFGGSSLSGQRLGDTWEWDGQRWTLVATTGPSPRSGHVMAYDSLRGVTVLFGGGTVNGLSGQTWEWDGKDWTLRHVTCIAECDTSTGIGVLDIIDFLCFQTAFVAGCP